MKRFYEGQRILDVTESFYQPSIPSEIAYSVLYTTKDGTLLFRCDIDESQHTTIVSLGNVEVIFDDVLDRAKLLFSPLFDAESANEVIEWRDK